MVRYLASWILPIVGPPIRDGWVLVDRGRVAAVGHRGPAPPGVRDEHLGPVAILPGLVNAHTHLELSYLRDQVGPASEFITWIRRVMAARKATGSPQSPEIRQEVARAIEEAVEAGTALVGDISNTLETFDPLVRSPLAGVLFYELIRFNATDAERLVETAVGRLEALGASGRLRASLAAHAPYSVSPPVFRAIRDAVNLGRVVPCSVHLAESAEEVEFIRTGGGPWRELLEELGVWDPAWTPPGVSPVEYLEREGFLGARVLAVHGVQTTAADLDNLARCGVTLVACPRSNSRTGAGTPPIADFYRSGVRVAVGTDSLASTPDLNVFAELAAMRALAPSVPAAALLDSATRQGARALGFEAEYGTLEPGRRARLLAVDVPAGVGDVEEYLVSGVHPQQLRWIQ
jgi:cytosine/adenosine deaminase-related metal-dependent hydrolase